LVITNSAAAGSGTLTVTAAVAAGGSATVTPLAPPAIAAGANATLAIACNNTTAAATTQTLTITHNGGAAGAASPVTHAITCAAPVVGTSITAGTASGTAQGFGSFTVGGTVPAARPLAFTATGAGAMTCALGGTNPTSFTVTPATLNFAAGALTQTTNVGVAAGLAVGTYNATLTCTPTAPATGGPFTYPLSVTVAPVAPVANVVQAPSLNFFGGMLLIAGFLGLGMVLTSRRN
jgi:hypothetical protein